MRKQEKIRSLLLEQIDLLSWKSCSIRIQKLPLPPKHIS